MSTFTRFSAEEHLVYDHVTSDKYDKDIWKVVPGYRYYIGEKNSNQYVDVETGFLTDGLTGPWIVNTVLPQVGRYTQATTLHDKLCRTYYFLKWRDGTEEMVRLSRKELDDIFIEALKVLNVPSWKIRVIQTGLWLYRVTNNPTTPKTFEESIR